jgi:hypothetical protein
MVKDLLNRPRVVGDSFDRAGQHLETFYPKFKQIRNKRRDERRPDA